jgi:two-component system sensor histidine kinase AtoS
MVAGPEVMPGWQPMLIIDPDRLISPFVAARQGLYLVAVLVVVVIVVLFARLSMRLRQRIGPLAQGAEALAAGRLDHRIEAVGDDEIGGLAQAFNAMAARLRDTLDRTVRVERLVVLGEFATGVAHEIRNPLATIKTAVQALARSEPDRERHGLLTDVEAEIDRLARVMDDLLAYGRPRPPEAAPMLAADLFRRVCGLMGRTAAEAQMTLAAPPGPAVTLFADRDQMMQVMVNLVINAVQAGHPGGRVTLHARAREGGGCEIVVEDDGSGIPPAIVDRVTEPFFTTRSRGTGLGLAICRQLVELNAGVLSVSTDPGRGTRVILRFGDEEGDGR